MEADLQSRLDLAITAAAKAGEVTLRYFRKASLQIDLKADQSPVTEADREAEKLLRSMVLEQFPDDSILGEEFGEQAGSSPYQWVFDPIDGTKSFIAGVPLYTTLIGIMDRASGESVAGVIFAPATAEMVHAARGAGAWYRIGQGPLIAARVSQVSPLSQSLFLTTDVKSFADHRTPDATDVYLKLQDSARLARTWGDAYGYLLVATGRAEAMIDPVMNLWDIAALMPILEEAGGKLTDWEGNRTIHSGESVATNGKIHESVLEFTRGYRESK